MGVGKKGFLKRETKLRGKGGKGVKDGKRRGKRKENRENMEWIMGGVNERN